MTFHTAGGKNTGANAFQQAVASQPVKTDKVTPSEGQRRLIESLIKEICEMDETTGNLAIDYTARMDARDAWTRGREGNISRWIERLIGKARELRQSTPPVKTVNPVKIEDGMYVLDGAVYKVIHAVHGSGRQYAKLLTKTGFAVAPGIVSRLSPEHRMTLDQAKEYGHLYGVCCNCGATLTDEKSIAAGIGPICASKF